MLISTYSPFLLWKKYKLILTDGINTSWHGHTCVVVFCFFFTSFPPSTAASTATASSSLRSTCLCCLHNTRLCQSHICHSSRPCAFDCRRHCEWSYCRETTVTHLQRLLSQALMDTMHWCCFCLAHKERYSVLRSDLSGALENSKINAREFLYLLL